MDEKIYEENEVVVTTINENNEVCTDIVSVDSEKSEIGAGEYAIIGLAVAGVIGLGTLAYKGGKKAITWAKGKFGKKHLEDFEEDDEFEDIADEIQEELEEDLKKDKK